MVLRRKETLTIITPIPGFIPRQLAIDILHSHSEVITLNPLVLSHKPISAPRDAQSDEFYSTWYEITQRVQLVPGVGKIGTGQIKFNGCFHDMPWGLQTHIYAPMNVDLRNKYRIEGNQPGFEPPVAPEIGLKSLGVPADGLYLREDIEIKANIAIVGHVKSELQKAGGEMVRRIIKKAELLDKGQLHAMIEDGKLKTFNPADRTHTGYAQGGPPDRSNTPMKSPGPSPVSLHHPGTPQPGHPGQPPLSPSLPYHIPRPVSYQPPAYSPHLSMNQPYRPPSAGPPPAGYPGHIAPPFGYNHGQPGPAQHFGPAELPSNIHNGPLPSSNAGPIEMPGDFYYAPPQPSPGLQPPAARQPSVRDSTVSAMSTESRSPDPSQGRWSEATNPAEYASRPASTASDGAGQPFRSPGLDHKGFSSELTTHAETTEENRDEALRKLDPRIPQPSHYPYDPSEYNKMQQPTHNLPSQMRYSQPPPTQ